MSEKSENIGFVDRRKFLKYSGMLGLGLTFTGIMPASESVAFDRKLRKVTRTRLSMGTFVAITVMHSSPGEADDAIANACNEMDRVTRILDRYDSTSPVGVLNRDGYLSDIPPEMAEVLDRSLHFYKTTNGVFDITVAPLVDFYKKHFDGQKTPPTEAQVAKVLSLVDGSAVKFDGKNVRFDKENMQITLDGIAKGYIIDQGAKALKKSGIQYALINAGGDIRAIGGKNSNTPWKVAVQNPEKTGPYLDTVHLRDGAIATSGNYEIYFDDEKLYHHIVNPETGKSPIESKSVSVLATTVVDADALSTSVFVMGPMNGNTFINNTPKTEVLIVTSSNQKIRSIGWPVA